MADFNPLDLLQQATQQTQQANTELGQQTADVAMINQNMQKLYTRSDEGMAKAIVGAQEVAGEKAAIDYARNKGLENAQRLYRMDPEQANYAAAEDMAVYEQARSERVGVRAEYDNLNSQSLIQNPLGWIIAQTRLPQVAARNNALADMEDEALEDIQKRETLLAARKSSFVANTADLIQANQLHEAEINSQIARANLDQKTAQNQAAIAAGRMQVISLEQQAFRNNRDLTQLQIQALGADEARQARIEAREGQADYKALQSLMLKEKLEEMKDKDEEKARYNARFAEISTSLGHKIPMTVDGLKRIPEKERLAWMAAAMSGGYGSGLGDAIMFFQDKQQLNPVENASVQGVANRIDAEAKKLAPSVKAGMDVANPNNKGQYTADQVRDAVYKAYKDKVVQSMSGQNATGPDLSSPAYDSSYNPYIAPLASTSKLADTQPELAPLKNNLMKQQVDLLLKDAGTVKGDSLSSDQMQTVLLSLRNKVEKGELRADVAAAQVSEFMKISSDINLRLNKYNLFGLPVQQNYSFTLQGDTVKTDLFNKGALENAFMRGIAEKKKQEQRNMDVGSVFLTGFAPLR